MKKLILLELALLFLATTFHSDNPPGWYQQTLPVSDQINDIFFLDSLNGWVITNGGPNDTAYIMRTINGGDNWNIQFQNTFGLNAIQFLDEESGFVVGNFYIGTNNNILKTSNGGSNWIELNVLNQLSWIDDLSFLNKDTGWICSADAFKGGVFKTTDGGISWQQQLNYGIDNPDRIFFINKDTGWTSNGGHDKLYRTINGGQNWNLQYTHTNQINDIFFFDGNTGIITGGINYRTINGGFTWIQSIGNVGGIKISMATDSVGWAGSDFNRISKTTNIGSSWGIQTSPLFNNQSVSAPDNLIAWAGGNGLVRTTDGGGPVMNIQQISNEIPNGFMIYQNYPNPFNPNTIIKYQLSAFSKISLKVFSIDGREIKELVNRNQSAGTYQYTFDGTGLSSGVYFYRLKVESKSKSFTETKMMLLVK